VLARAQGASPTYEPVGLGCAAVYCHGNFDYNGVKGKAASVVWDGGAVGCEDCHDLPPTGHPALPGTVTPATCNGCHPYTVNASGTINVGSGAHINGRTEVSGNPHTGDPQWVDRTHHGYQASSQGMAACTSCHANFDGPSGTAAGSCNACHAAAGFATWQTNCTFCHGTASRTATALNPQLPAAPPVDSAGNGDTAPRARGVGAHSKHLVSPTISSAFACGNCHSSSLPTNVTHVDGQRAVLPFGLIAATGNVNPHFDTATLSCSTVYCHGAFGTVGQTTAAPVWTSTTPMTCTSCHKMPATSTGRHSLHMGQNGMNCSTCHNGIASGTGDPSTNATITGPSLHVNGQKNVAFGGTFGGNPVSGTYSGGNCTISCHGRESW
jgi:predicted CxxxxCH...CXXCH cytochrome family protein